MLKLIARRLALGLLTLLVVSVIIFIGTEILPGDVATAILGQSATEENTAAIREQLGLNRPPHERYLSWLGAFVQGDLGTSLGNRRPIAPQIGFRFENTMMLAALAALIAVPLAIGLGLISAIKQGTPLDRGISVGSLMAISVPEFFIGYVLILIVAVELSWLPSLSNVNDRMDFGDRLEAMALPAITLTLVTLAHMMRMTRAAVIGVMSSSYIEMAHLKGVKYWRIVVQHALPNVLSPIITVVMLNLAYLVVGVVVVEVVYTYPGMGQYMVDSVSKRDVPVVQACGLIFAGVWVLLILAADIASILANPRLRHPK
ncbi:MAG: ABC transporter permease [Rhodospirillales bacterium]|nr:ABC transporter permease [Rhodospirillales bacterium]